MFVVTSTQAKINTILILKDYIIMINFRFGEEHVESLKARFGDILVRQNLETSELLTEWRLLKSLVYRRLVCRIK